MTTNVGTADITLKIDRAKLSKDIDKAGREVDDKFGKVGEKAGRTFMESARKYSMAGGLVAGASLIAAKGLADAASDQAEALNKARVVFGDYSADVEAFANSGAKALGMSKTAALEYTGTLGNLLLSAELLPAKAAEMSTTLVQLAADMASFNNSSPEEALEALRSGLSGETEPLKRFGVNLNDATLKQEALNLGIYDGTGVLTANQKAQAAYAVILKQTTTAQGDFARTSDGAANKQRTLKAQIDDQKAAIGEGLLPAYSGLLGVLGGAAEQFAKLPPVVSGGALALTAMGGAALFMAPKIVDGVDAVKKLAPEMSKASAKMSNFTRSMTRGKIAAVGFATVGIAAVVAGIGKLNDAQEQRSQDDIDERMAGIEGLADKAQVAAEALRAAEADFRSDPFRTREFPDWVPFESPDFTGTRTAVENLEDELRAAEQALLDTGTAAEIAAYKGEVGFRYFGEEAIGRSLGAATDKAGKDVEDLGDTAKDAAERAKTAWEKFYDKLGEKDEAVDRAGSVFQQLFGGNGVDEASQTLVEAQQALAASMAEGGNSFDIQTEAGQANRRALQAVRDAQIAYLDALLATGNYSKDELHFAFQTVADDLFDVLDNGGATEGQMAALRQELRLTPAAIEQAFNTAPIDEAIDKAKEATRALLTQVYLMNELVRMNAEAEAAAQNASPGYYGHGFNYSTGTYPGAPPPAPVTVGSVGGVPAGVGGRSVVINQHNYGISAEAASRQAVRLVRAA